MAFRHLKKVFSSTSERVKCVELHPTEPMLVTALFDGTVQIYNTNSWTELRTIRVGNNNLCKPVRCVKWMPSHQAIIAACDDKKIYAYNYNTGSLMASVEAHADFIRSLAIHPTQPLILSASDDYTVKLFRLKTSENDKFILSEERVFEGHTHFVMDVKFNPKDPSTFATASLDYKIKFWGINESKPRFTLEGHKAGVNCIEFQPGTDGPYLASGSDDLSIRIWDYQNRMCTHIITCTSETQPGYHHGNITSLRYHPKFPLLFSTAEDRKVILWNSHTHTQETEFDFGKERGWSIDCNDSTIVVGFDRGMVVMEFGKSSILVTANPDGKTYWADGNQIYQAGLNMVTDAEDGKVCEVRSKEAHLSEFYPASLKLDRKSQMAAICGDNEYAIYSTLSWRSKRSGRAKEFVWSLNNTYAIRENRNKVTITSIMAAKAGSKYDDINVELECDANTIFGGYLLAVASEEEVYFHSWDDGLPLKCGPLTAKATNIIWNNDNNKDGTLLAVTTSDSLNILRFIEDDPDKPDPYFVEEFQLDANVKSGCWYDDTFFFSDDKSVSFVIGDHREVIARFDQPYMVASYVNSRVFLCDKNYNWISYSVPNTILNAFSKYALEDNEDIDIDIDGIPDNWRARFRNFLEERGKFEEALKLAETNEKKFELALKIPNYQLAVEIARKTKNLSQWQHISQIAVKTGQVDLLEEALKISGDGNGLLLLNSVCGRKKEMKELAESQSTAKNVSFAAYFALGDFSKCIDILIETGREPEAALMARTYCPKRIAECVELWQNKLRSRGNKRLADSIASPKEYPDMFQLDDEDAEPEPEPPVEKPKQEEKPAVVKSSTEKTSAAKPAAEKPPVAKPAAKVEEPKNDEAEEEDVNIDELLEGIGGEEEDL